jgi:hypothetical protein
MSKKTNNLWIDLESDSSNDEHEPSKENGCLICSIIPVLSDRNCCSKHITALSKTVGDMLPSSGKQRFHRHSKKLRPIILTSFVIRQIFHLKLFHLAFFSRVKTIICLLRLHKLISE